MEHADKKLVEKLLAGDERAFEAFFNGQFPRLFRFSLPRVNGDRDLAEEIVQSVLCRAVRKLDSYRGEASLFTWLCTFCRNEISAHVRRSRRISATVELREDDPEIRAALESLSTAAASDPTLAYDRGELARIVQVTLDHLPSAYGDALEWKYMQGHSVKEISERLGRGPKAVESMLSRARVAFRDGFSAMLGTAREYAPVDPDMGTRRVGVWK